MTVWYTLGDCVWLLSLFNFLFSLTKLELYSLFNYSQGLVSGPSHCMQAKEPRRCKTVCEKFPDQVNLADQNTGETPLHISCDKGEDGLEFIWLLVDAGADVDQQGLNDETPKGIAMEKGIDLQLLLPSTRFEDCLIDPGCIEPNVLDPIECESKRIGPESSDGLVFHGTLTSDDGRKEVAVKINRHGSKDAYRRILREARYLALFPLKEKNIVQLYKYGRGVSMCGHAIGFTVMKYYKNGSLHSHLSNLKKNNEKLKPVQFIRWMYDLCIGLCTLHSFEYGIIHRDLHLNNVFIDDDMSLVIGDFGRSARVLSELASNQHTETKCNPDIMAPELKENLSNGDFLSYTKETDIYALGLCLATMEAQTEESLAEYTYYPDLNKVLKGCTDSDPTKRPLISTLLGTATSSLRAERRRCKEAAMGSSQLEAVVDKPL